MIAKRVCSVLVSLAVMAAACGSDDATDDGAGSTATGPASTEAVEPAAGGVLRFGYDIALSRFDPHRSTLSQDGVTLFPTYDRLVHQDPDGNPVPGLATEWEFSDDGLALTFSLREGVTFHDGAVFDAAAVKANIERAQTVEGGSHIGDLAVITSIGVLDELEVRFLLDGAAPQLPLVLSDRAGAMVSPAAFDNGDLDVAPVGAGMYRVTEYVAGDRVVYERYETTGTSTPFASTAWRSASSPIPPRG